MTKNAKKVLVAGGCGFIGSHFVDRALKRSVVAANLWISFDEDLVHIRDPRFHFTRAGDGRSVFSFIARGPSGKPTTVSGDGKQSQSWGYVDGIVAGLGRYFWLDRIDYPGLVNIDLDRKIFVLELADYVARLTGANKVMHLPSAPQDPTNWRPDLTLARKPLRDWVCKAPHQKDVEMTLDWFRAPAIAQCGGRASGLSGEPIESMAL